MATALDGDGDGLTLAMGADGQQKEIALGDKKAGLAGE
jgi:hypothetical protein